MTEQTTPTPQYQKMCKACFEAVHPEAEICPKCGVRQFNPLSKGALLLLAFFLGGFGAHKFYLGKHVQGVIYLVFCWSMIPGLIAFVEFIIYLFTDDDTLQRRYQGVRGDGAAAVIIACVVGGMGLVSIIGILAAIAIPQFAAYRQRAACTIVEQAAQAASVTVSQFFLDSDQSQAPSMAELEALGFSPRERVAVEVSGTREAYTIQAHDRTGQCRDGQAYVLSEPSEEGDAGWQ